MLERHIQDYINLESYRQSDDPQEMTDAYAHLVKHIDSGGEITLSVIAEFGEVFTGKYGFRSTPVYFSTGGTALKAALIHDALNTLLNYQPQLGNLQEVMPWIKRFLEIHAWDDGNGRGASLLFNYFLGTLDTPLPLPFYRFY